MEIELLGLVAEGHGHIETGNSGDVDMFAHTDVVTGHIFADHGEYAPEIICEVINSLRDIEQPLLTARLDDIEYTFDSYAINLVRHNEGRISVEFEAAAVNTNVRVMENGD
jgi:hypothetical protein